MRDKTCVEAVRLSCSPEMSVTASRDAPSTFSSVEPSCYSVGSVSKYSKCGMFGVGFCSFVDISRWR